jgi:hypothetical protein
VKKKNHLKIYIGCFDKKKMISTTYISIWEWFHLNPPTIKLSYICLSKKLKIECARWLDTKYLYACVKKNPAVMHEGNYLILFLHKSNYQIFTSLFILNDCIETIAQLSNFTVHTTWYSSHCLHRVIGL